MNQLLNPKQFNKTEILYTFPFLSSPNLFPYIPASSTFSLQFFPMQLPVSGILQLRAVTFYFFLSPVTHYISLCAKLSYAQGVLQIMVARTRPL